MENNKKSSGPLEKGRKRKTKFYPDDLLKFISGSALTVVNRSVDEILNYSNYLLLANQLASIRSLTSEFLTSDEAADYLGISVESLRNMTSNGKVPFYKLPGTRSNRYLVRELRELLLCSRQGGFHGN